MTEQEQKAIDQMNKALNGLKKVGIKICGMDDTLLYATKKALKKHTNAHKEVGTYCAVANANKLAEEGTGRFKADCYEDSGGW